jgi:hypothetical protein
LVRDQSRRVEFKPFTVTTPTGTQGQPWVLLEWITMLRFNYAAASNAVSSYLGFASGKLLDVLGSSRSKRRQSKLGVIGMLTQDPMQSEPLASRTSLVVCKLPYSLSRNVQGFRTRRAFS